MSFELYFQENTNAGEMPRPPHKIIKPGSDPDAQKNINTSEAGVGTGKDNKTSHMPRFIWTIQTIDEQGAGFNSGVGDGRSEPFWFQIKSTKEIFDKRKE